jgi:hypothetical protein
MTPATAFGLAMLIASVADADELRTPTSFSSIADPKARAQAIFVELTRVLLHPRCMNCHPDGDTPTQGERSVRHDPPVVRGPDDSGVPAMRCNSCHQDRNLELARVPGAPKWAVAPRIMAWANRTPHAICEQLKDRARNGGRDLSQIIDHVDHDPLVAWAWAPGADRQPAPGSAAAAAALLDAWRKNGAACPEEKR